MSSDGDSALEKAASEVLSVSSELSRLRGAVESHGRAADALSEASSELRQLAGTIAALPNGFAEHFERGALVVGAIETALAPAGELRSGMLQVNEKFAGVATSQALGEGVAQLVHGMAERAEGLRDEFERSLSKASGSMVEGLDGIKRLIAEWEQHIRARFQSVDSRIEAVEDGIRVLESKISGVEERLDAQALLIKKYNEQTTEHLTVLEKLARRSLLAILMGKDAPAK